MVRSTGVFDSFHDEDSECPKCHAKIGGDWQTQRLESLFASWRKGDFLQYHKYELIPEEERKKKYGDRAFAPIIRRTKEYQSDAPLLFNAKVPVHTSCDNCKAWLEAYAKIVSGRFAGIVEAEADVREKEMVLISPDAKTLREEFETRLSHLQESCRHESAKWMDIESKLGYFEPGLVCRKCEKILKTEKEQRGLDRLRDRDRLRGAAARTDEARRKIGPMKGWNSTEVIRKWRDLRKPSS